MSDALLSRKKRAERRFKEVIPCEKRDERRPEGEDEGGCPVVSRAQTLARLPFLHIDLAAGEWVCCESSVPDVEPLTREKRDERLPEGETEDHSRPDRRFRRTMTLRTICGRRGGGRWGRVSESPSSTGGSMTASGERASCASHSCAPPLLDDVSG